MQGVCVEGWLTTVGGGGGGGGGYFKAYPVLWQVTVMQDVGVLVCGDAHCLLLLFFTLQALLESVDCWKKCPWSFVRVCLFLCRVFPPTLLFHHSVNAWTVFKKKCWFSLTVQSLQTFWGKPPFQSNKTACKRTVKEWLMKKANEDVPLVELCTLYILACQVSYCRRLGSLLLCWCCIFQALVNSLACWFSDKWKCTYPIAVGMCRMPGDDVLTVVLSLWRRGWSWKFAHGLNCHIFNS